MLDTLLAAGLSAASKSDLQQVSLIRIADRAVRGRIGALLSSMPWIVQAPEFFVVCGDNRRIRRVCELRGLAYANDTMDAVLNAAVDAPALGGPQRTVEHPVEVAHLAEGVKSLYGRHILSSRGIGTLAEDFVGRSLGR